MEHRLDGVRKRVEMLRSSLASVQNRREALAMAINQCNWARGSFEEALEVKAAALKSEVDAQVKREKALITEKARRYCVPVAHEKNEAENQIQRVAQLISHVRRNLDLETVESLDDDLHEALAELEMGDMEYEPLDVVHFGPLPGWKLILDGSRRLARPQSSKVRKHKRCEDDGWVYDDTEGEWTHRKDLSRPQSAKGHRGYIDIESDDSWVYNDEAGSSEAQVEEEERYWARRPMREQRRTRMRPRDDRRADNHFRAHRTTAQHRPFLPATMDDDPIVLYEDDSDGDSYTRPRPLGELLTTSSQLRPRSRMNYAATEILTSSRPEVAHRRRDVAHTDELVPPTISRSWVRVQRDARNGVEDMEGVAGYRSGGSARREHHKSPRHVGRQEMGGQMRRWAVEERRMRGDTVVDRNVPVHSAHPELDQRAWRPQQANTGHATSTKADAHAIPSFRCDNISDGDVQVEYGVQEHGPMLNGIHERSSRKERELSDRLLQEHQQEFRSQQHQQAQPQPHQQTQRSPNAPGTVRSGGAAGSLHGKVAGQSTRNEWSEEDVTATATGVQRVHESDEQRSPTASSCRSAGFVHSAVPLNSISGNGVYRTPARQGQQGAHATIPTTLIHRGVRSNRPQSSKERKHKRCEEEDGWVYEDHVESMASGPCAQNATNHLEPQLLPGEDDFADIPEPRWHDPATHRLRVRTPCHVSLMHIARDEDTLSNPREATSVRCFLSTNGAPAASLNPDVSSPIDTVTAGANQHGSTIIGTHYFDVALTSADVTVSELLQDVGPLATGYYSTHADGVMLFVRTHKSGLPLPLAEEEKVTSVLNEWKSISEEGWPRLFLLPAA